MYFKDKAGVSFHARLDEATTVHGLALRNEMGHEMRHEWGPIVDAAAWD
ncbi:MAG: hypothetical protein ACLQMF_07280 [Rectinemataceae bacterium]